MKKISGILIWLLLAGNLSGAPLTRTIVVFPFVNQTARADLAWMSEGFAVALSRRLAGPYRFVLGRRERNTACEDGGLSAGTPLTLASLYKVAETLGVDWAVVGSFNVEAKQLTVQAQILDARDLRLFTPVVATGEMADLVDLEAQLAWRLLAAHDPTFTVGKEEDFRRQFPEVRLDAFESYIRGILAGDTDTRIQFLTESDRRNPADHRAALELGRTYFDEKDYARSVLWLRKLAPSDDHYTESLFRLGVCEYFLGHDAEAAKDFNQVARQLPLNEVYNNLGVVEYHTGHFEDAIEDFNRAHRGDATNSQFSFNRGACLWSLKKYPEAAKALKDALGADDEDPEAHLLLADTLAKLGDAAGAQAEKKWLADHGSPPAPASSLTADYSPQPRLMKNYDGRAFRLLALTIRNALEAKLSQEPPARHAAAHISRSRKLIDEGNYTEAEQDLTEAISLAPANNEAHLLLAQVYEAEGRHADAAAELETSLKLDNNAGAQLWLARIDLSLGRTGQAQEHGKAALALEPSNQDAAQLVREIQDHTSAPGSKP
jgi:tetratricopeptide (TPR) repeat protein